MSSYRKVRSSRSIYHPGISLNREPTYNQKKGMILTRSTNLPQPVHKVVTAQSLRDDARKLIKSGYVNYRRVTLNFSVGHQDNTWSIDEGNIRQFLTEKFGPGTNIIAANVNQFIFNASFSRNIWPDIDYTLSIGDDDVSITTTHPSSVAAGVSSYLGSAVFNTPNYVPLASPTIYNLVCPQFEMHTSSSNYGWARVVNSPINISSSMKTTLDELHGLGFTEIPFCSFGDIYPYPISTVLTFDASGVSTDIPITLQLSCDVYYIK